jgi:hypothetical protein
MDGLPSSDVARRFGYSAGAFRVLCHAFHRRELPEFFAATRPGRREQPKKSRAHDQIVALRKRNYSVYEISQALKEQGMALSSTAVREVLAAEDAIPPVAQTASARLQAVFHGTILCLIMQHIRLQLAGR